MLWPHVEFGSIRMTATMMAAPTRGSATLAKRASPLPGPRANHATTLTQ